MATITTRSGKGSPLTNTEVDNNFTNLNNAKYESGSSPVFYYLTVQGDTSGNEGGEVKLEGAGTNADLFLDNFSSAFRVHSGGTTKLQVESTGSLLMREGGVFNNSSADSDFQVKSQNNANMFFVDAGTDRVGVGTNNPQHTLDVYGSMSLGKSGTNGAWDFRMWPDTAGRSVIGLRNRDNYLAIMSGDPLSNELFTLTTGGRGVFKGGLVVNQDGAPAEDFRVESDGN